MRFRTFLVSTLLVPALFAQSSVRVDVDLVLINAAVTDPSGRSVRGLSKTSFTLWEDKVQQDIQYFSSTEVPVSVAIVFDVSSSMADKLQASREAVATFLRMGNPEDEYALVEFNSRPQLTQDFDQDYVRFHSHLVSTSAVGSTALYDAVYLGIEKLRYSHNPRKALLLVTDGEDNHSRYTFTDIKEFAMESDVQLFAIRIGGLTNPTETKGHKWGGAVLQELVSVSGGQLFFANNGQGLEQICSNISEILRNEYVIGYTPTNRNKDGKWRGLKLKVNTTSRASVQSRSGYYAPAQ